MSGCQCKMLAKKIRELRNRKKLSQEKLARLAGVSFVTIVKIESGESKNPTIKTMAGIANALGISLDELIKGNSFLSMKKSENRP